MTESCTCVIVARRGTGKSVMLKHILFINKDFFFEVWVFAGSVAVIKDWRGIVPPTHIVDGYCPEKFREIEARATDFENTGMRRQIVIFFDDLAFDKVMMKDVAFVKAFMNSRHIGVSLFLITQFVTLVPPAIRGQADWVIALREADRGNQKRLYDYWFGIVSTQAEFRRILQAATSNYGGLVLKSKAVGYDLTKCLFRIVADYETIKNVPFRLCHPIIWREYEAQKIIAKIRKLKEEMKREAALQNGAILI